jgi:hypothetical protein
VERERLSIAEPGAVMFSVQRRGAMSTTDMARWDGPIGALADRAMALAVGTDDATNAALVLCETGRLHHVDPLGLFAGVRYRLAGVLDRDPADLLALAALGLVAQAALEPPPRRLARRHPPVDD